MFTGLIEAVTGVRSLQGPRLTIDRPALFQDVVPGASIAVAGVCLTVEELDTAILRFHLSPETLERTTIREWKKGHRVNLERALPATGRFGGHIVQGHVDSVGMVVSLSPVLLRIQQTIQKHSPPPSGEGLGEREKEKGVELGIEIPSSLISFVVPKGSIAIDGVSLTVTRMSGNQCACALIPHTLTSTTLGSLTAGDRVNIETDILGKYVRTMMTPV